MFVRRTVGLSGVGKDMRIVYFTAVDHFSINV